MMMHSIRFAAIARAVCLALLAIVGLSGPTETYAAEPSTKPIDYASRVEPILRKYCFACHGNGADEGDLALDRITQTLRPADDHFK